MLQKLSFVIISLLIRERKSYDICLYGNSSIAHTSYLAAISLFLNHSKSNKDSPENWFWRFFRYHGNEKSPEDIGDEGELEVWATLRQFKEKQYVFNNYKTMNGERTCQIDHIVVNTSGVFVLETKNYKGIISGSRNQREWIQTLANGEQNSLYNPIMQNNTHKGVVKNIIGNDVPLYAYVVFTHNDLRFINEPDVIRLDELHDHIYCHEPTLSIETAVSIIEKLQAHKANFSDEEHVKNINQAKWEVEHNICPRCQGKLVLRHGKYGDFYGCENYPQCKFKKKLDD